MDMLKSIWSVISFLDDVHTELTIEDFDAFFGSTDSDDINYESEKTINTNK